MARARRPIRELEGDILHDMYRRNGGMWDVILNDVRRDGRFQQLPQNVQEVYTDGGQRTFARRRVRNFIAREQRR